MISPQTADDVLRIITAAGRVVDAYRAGKIVSMPASPDADRMLLDLEASLVRPGMRLPDRRPRRPLANGPAGSEALDQELCPNCGGRVRGQGHAPGWCDRCQPTTGG